MGLMPVAEALSRVLVDAHPLPAESAALMDAYGRVLTSDIVALRSQPPADVSAMDGYAVRAADVAAAPAPPPPPPSVKQPILASAVEGSAVNNTVAIGRIWFSTQLFSHFRSLSSR